MKKITFYNNHTAGWLTHKFFGWWTVLRWKIYSIIYILTYDLLKTHINPPSDQHINETCTTQAARIFVSSSLHTWILLRLALLVHFLLGTRRWSQQSHSQVSPNHIKITHSSLITALFTFPFLQCKRYYNLTNMKYRKFCLLVHVCTIKKTKRYQAFWAGLWIDTIYWFGLKILVEKTDFFRRFSYNSINKGRGHFDIFYL